MTYEYVCTACQHEWEATQPISDPALKDCPQCHKQTARRQVSGGTGFVLKGGGWYSDLYSSSRPAESKKDESATAPAASESSGDKATPSPAATSSTTETKAAAPAKAASDSSS